MSKRIAVLTGAGISTDSGIPDYRGPSGVWTRDPELAGLFTRKHFLANAGVRRRFWRALTLYDDVEPNPAHLALAELERTTAVRILTQNVDGLHQKAGSTPRKVLELHGNLAATECMRCHARTPTAEVLARGEDDPACTGCGGVLQPSIVLFGQHLNAGVLSHAANIARASEVFVAVGSSLGVEPAAGLCAVAAESGATVVIVNRDPTPYDHLAATIVREPIGEALPALCTELAG
ncbi:Sir2 family NAD-dependent protein deacetylase [Actinomadura sp. WMMB 499]|uniref:SIR2 family NAD-dependent protein deacylase n=1 Tax=Actinomadura sp. WMMB 499 TaxID=1219491 RepID=UPI00124629CD|nr:Sir2 family NAD-dependent protein deacetylase [Actinomadura sp. WMMB 499]QFG20342.1 NAD-dependent deacetylase [Actinomadura sp. WMMB 499]